MTEILGLFSLIHGESKVGKSWLGYTSPKPCLILDAEGRTKFLRGKVVWNPLTEAPPEPGEWEYCVVYVNDWRALDASYRWLVSGAHPFKSVVLDSLTELQKRCIDDVSGTSKMDYDAFGEVLRAVEDIVRKFRDLTLPTAKKQLYACTIICLTIMKDGKFRPFVKGQLAIILPGHADLIGYYYPDQDTSGATIRKLLIQPSQQFVAGDGTDLLSSHYGPVITNPNITDMLNVMNQENSNG